MQISRHWRMNGVRYGLEGFRLANGELSLQPRTIRRTKEGTLSRGSNAEKRKTQAESNASDRTLLAALAEEVHAT